MKYIDVHCHLDSKEFDPDRGEILGRMEKEGVGAITIGSDLEKSKKAVEIAEANKNVWACIGVHPEYLTSPRPDVHWGDPLLETGEGKNAALPLHLGEGQPRLAGWDEVLEFEKLIKNPKVVGIGECGLDYFGRRSLSEGDLSKEKEKQKNLFESQIQFALKHDKPLMLHIRDAYHDALEILRSYSGIRGNVHFFVGDIEIAKKFLDLGFTMSFTGVITFTHDYDEVIKYLPSDSVISETDAPRVAPVPFRGKRNEPVFVIEVAKKMAEIRGEEVEELTKSIFKNAERVFKMGA